MCVCACAYICACGWYLVCGCFQACGNGKRMRDDADCGKLRVLHCCCVLRLACVLCVGSRARAVVRPAFWQARLLCLCTAATSTFRHPSGCRRSQSAAPLCSARALVFLRRAARESENARRMKGNQPSSGFLESGGARPGHTNTCAIAPAHTASLHIQVFITHYSPAQRRRRQTRARKTPHRRLSQNADG